MSSKPVFKKLVGMLANAKSETDIGRIASWANAAFGLGQLTKKEYWALAVSIDFAWRTRKLRRGKPRAGSDREARRNKNARAYVRGSKSRSKRGKKQ